MSRQPRTELPKTMPFGRYRRQPLRLLPPDYLRYLVTQDLREPLKTAVEIEYRMRGQTGKDER